MKAAIDIGSNSVRLAFSDGSVRSEITKLADGLTATGKLSPTGIRNTIQALSEFIAEADRHGAEITAFATEAVRRASDGGEFISAVKAELGLTVRLLSEQDEARLALLGAQKPEGAVTVCDLGGGSMELISSPDGEAFDYAKSLPLGVVVLKNNYNGDFARLARELPFLLKQYGELPRRNLVISGGSACAIAAALKNLKTYDKAAVTDKYTARELDGAIPMLLSPRLSVMRPVCARRADTIPYGAYIIRALLGYLNADSFYVSDAGNLDAVLKYGL